MRVLPGAARWMVFAVLLLMAVVTPMPWMTVVGMEHIMHACLTLCFVFLAAGQLGRDPGEARRGRVCLLVLAALLPMARYEGLFVVFVVCVLLLARRQRLDAAGMGLAALAPVVAYGLWSVGNGWWFLPSPVLLKGQQPSVSSPVGILNLLGLRGLTTLWHSPHIMVLVGAVGLQLTYIRSKRRTPRDSVRTYVSLVYLGAVWLHLQFANVGWYNRYESYLMVLGLAALSTSLEDVLTAIRKWTLSRRTLLYTAAAVPLLMLLAAPLYAVAYRSLVAPRAMDNIFRQQYQMGMFINRFYAGRAVALNDIGAVCYLADIKLLDLCGLGSIETARLARRRNLSTRQISELADGQRVAIGVVHDYLFEPCGGLPGQWTRAGIWKIPRNVVCGSNAVSLYAPTLSAAEELDRNLRRFGAELPEEVLQIGRYTENDEPPTPSTFRAGGES